MLMASQQVEYDFGVYSLPMPVDSPVTVLSVGSSLLKSSVDLELPINAAGDGVSVSKYCNTCHHHIYTVTKFSGR